MTDTKTPVTRTTAGLRTTLMDELDSLRAGTSNPSHSNAVARLVSGVTDVMRIELDTRKYLAGIGDATGAMQSIDL